MSEDKPTTLEEYKRRHPVRRNPDTGEIVNDKPGFFSRQVSGVRAKIKAADEKRAKEKAAIEAARAKGRAKGLAEAAEARGIEEGRKAGKYGTGVGGFFKGATAPKTTTVRTTTYQGKGKNRRKVVTTREVPAKGGGGGVRGFLGSFDPAGGMESAFGMDTAGKGKGQGQSGPFGGDLASGWESEDPLRPKGRKKQSSDPFGF